MKHRIARATGALLLALLVPSVAWASDQGGAAALLFLFAIFVLPALLAALEFALTVVLSVVSPAKPARRWVFGLAVISVIVSGLVLVLSVGGPALIGDLGGGVWAYLPAAMALTGLLIATAHLVGELGGVAWLGLRVVAWALPLAVPVIAVVGMVVSEAGDAARDSHLVQRLQGHFLGTTSLGFVDGGEAIFAAGYGSGSHGERHLQRYARQDGLWQRQPPTHTLDEKVEAAAVNGALGRALVATATQVWVIDPGAADKSRLLPDSSGLYMAVALSADGRFGAAAGVGQVRVWSLDDEGEPRSFQPLEKGSDALVFGPEARTILAVGADQKLVVVDVASGEARCVLPNVQANVLVLDADGTHVLSGGTDGVVRRWDVDACASAGVVATHHASVTALTFSADHSILAVGDSRSRVSLSPLPSGDAVALGQVSIKDDPYGFNEVTSIAFHPDGRTLVAGSVGNLGTMALFRLP